MKSITRNHLIKILDELLNKNVPILINIDKEIGEMGNLKKSLPQYIKNRCIVFEVT